MPTIHQFAPRITSGDAVGNAVLALRRLFREAGHASEAYAIEAPRAADAVLPYRRLFRVVAPDDALVLHYAVGSDAFASLARLPARRILVYHNLTPPSFFLGTNPHAAAFAEQGQRQLGELAGSVDRAIAVSEFNRRDLVAAGFADATAVPLLVDWSAYDVPPDPVALARWRAPAPVLLFVGRIAPNKRQDDLIRLLAYIRRGVHPEARLLLVGGYADQPRYHESLAALAGRLGVADAVTFAGPVQMPGLVAAYRAGSCFVSLSEHEGFGVPLLEAMRFQVPVLAYDAAAVGETVDGGGVLLRRKDDLAAIAETIALVLERPRLREGLVAAGGARVADFAWHRTAPRWLAAVAS